MDYTYGQVALGLGILVLLIAQLGVKNAKSRKTWTWIGVVALILGGIGLLAPGTIGFLDDPVSFGTLAVSGAGTTTVTSSGATTYQPTASYATTDKYSSTTTITGTSYYKRTGVRPITNPKSKAQKITPIIASCTKVDNSVNHDII